MTRSASDGCVASTDRKPRLVFRDAPDRSGGVGVNCQWEAAFKMQVALDFEAKRQCYRRYLGKVGRTHFGATKAKVAKAKQGVAVFIQFGKQPCGSTYR
jgi:hypothetical protein